MLKKVFEKSYVSEMLALLIVVVIGIAMVCEAVISTALAMDVRCFIAGCGVLNIGFNMQALWWLDNIHDLMTVEEEKSKEAES